MRTSKTNMSKPKYKIGSVMHDWYMTQTFLIVNIVSYETFQAYEFFCMKSKKLHLIDTMNVDNNDLLTPIEKLKL